VQFSYSDSVGMDDMLMKCLKSYITNTTTTWSMVV